MANIILYFGSFNPIHNGHTSVARYVVGQGLCDELWFIVSPKNPLKESSGLATDEDRLKMAEIAVAERLDSVKVKVSSVEFDMPRPSYTIDTLRKLQYEFAQHTFSVLAGADIIKGIERWKDHHTLLADYKFYIYPRHGYSLGKYEGRVEFLKDAPMWDYSSTDIREALAEGKDVSDKVACGVSRYIEEHRLWQDGEIVMQIKRLDLEITSKPTVELYIKRGKLYKRKGEFDKALNDFLKAKELEPGNEEVMAFIKMLREIFAFRYLDYYNP